MKEIFDTVISEIYGAWRFRWWGMLLAWVVALGGWAFVSTMPNEYRASARVLVNTNTDLREIIQRQGLTIPPDIISEVAQVRVAMLGRPQLEKVARQTDLHLGITTDAGMESLVSGLRSKINISGGESRGRNERDNLFQISFTYTSRDKAIDVVSTLLNILVEDTLGASRSGAEGSIEILEEQQSVADQRLRAAENRLRDFRRENVGLMPDERGGYFSRLQSTQTSLREAERERALKQNQLDKIEEQLRSEAPVMVSGTQDAMPENSLEARIQRLESEIEQLLVRFTDKHPEVVAKREILTELQDRRAAELEAQVEGDGLTPAAASNPVHQQLRIERNQVEVEIGQQDVIIRDLRAQVRELTEIRDKAIEVETELAQLDRDYEIIQNQYSSITEALEKARLSDDVVGPVEFQVIDPPSAAFEPVAPNRSILLLLCLAGGLGAGGGLAFLIHQVRPVFNTSDEIRREVGLPVLGTVAMAWRDKFRARTIRQSIAFGIAAAGLIGICGFTLMLNARGAFPLI